MTRQSPAEFTYFGPNRAIRAILQPCRCCCRDPMRIPPAEEADAILFPIEADDRWELVYIQQSFFELYSFLRRKNSLELVRTSYKCFEKKGKKGLLFRAFVFNSFETLIYDINFNKVRELNMVRDE